MSTLDRYSVLLTWEMWQDASYGQVCRREICTGDTTQDHTLYMPAPVKGKGAMQTLAGQLSRLPSFSKTLMRLIA